MFNETKVLGYEIKGMIIYRQISYMNVILRNPELGSHFLLLSCFFFPKPWFLEPYYNFYHFYNFCNSMGPKLLCRFHLFLLSPNFILSVAEKILCSETIAKEVSQLHSSNSLLTEKSFNIKYGKM